jgi:hypothetical protein
MNGIKFKTAVKAAFAAAAMLAAAAVVSAPGADAAAGTSVLMPGETLYAGQSLIDGPYTMAMQTDGNFVLYKGNQPLWQSGTYGHPNSWVVMQTDGNLVVYTPGPEVSPLWQSGTYNQPGDHLVVQSDGNAVIYTPNWHAPWATNTAQAPRPADVLLRSVKFGPTVYTGAKLLSNCSLDPLFCYPTSVSYKETASGTYEVWAHRDGTVPTIYYVVKTIYAALYIYGHKSNEFSPVGFGNVVKITDQNPCGGPATTTDESSRGVYVPSTYPPSDTSVAENYAINARFTQPTIYVSGGAVFPGDVENAPDGFNLEITTPLGNSCK